MEIAVVGIDLGKNKCSVVGLDAAGKVVTRRRMQRESVLKFTASLPPCVVAMEACCGAHHIGRIVLSQGHQVRLMSPEYVKPYVKAQKNDDRDAEGIAEAATRPTMRFVELKSQAQLDMQTLHRARDRLVGERTALINQLRAILLERGIVVAKGRRKLEMALDAMLTEPDGLQLTPRCSSWSKTCGQSGGPSINGSRPSVTFAARARTDEPARLLSTIPGIGVINATALVGRSDGARHSNAPETFRLGSASWLGDTTGGKPRLLGITKRGNRYLRKLLIHGARAALPSLSQRNTPLGAWLRGLLARRHHNVAVVALANKLARIAWAVLRTGRPYHTNAAVSA